MLTRQENFNRGFFKILTGFVMFFSFGYLRPDWDVDYVAYCMLKPGKWSK